MVRINRQGRPGAWRACADRSAPQRISAGVLVNGASNKAHTEP
jgi:hypothetical protein